MASSTEHFAEPHKTTIQSFYNQKRKDDKRASTLRTAGAVVM
jgi:hypothetical protein